MSNQYIDKLRDFSSTEVSAALLRLLHPSAIRLVLQDLSKKRFPPRASSRHLAEVMRWLCRAQDHGGGSGGVSAGFSLIKGWLPPYPETTGYIIPTFFDYANLTGLQEMHDRAIRMAEWEIAVQLPSGA